MSNAALGQVTSARPNRILKRGIERLRAFFPAIFGKINPNLAISHTIHNRILILDISTACGISAAKALIQRMENGTESLDLSGCHTAVINIRKAADLQFLSMYLAAPPGPAFMKRFGSHKDISPDQRQVTFRLFSREATHQLFNLITNSLNGKVGTMQDHIPFFKANLKFHVPTGEKSRLTERAKNTISILKGCLPKNYHGVLDAQLKEILEYINTNVKEEPLPQASYYPSSAMTSRSVKKIPKEDIQALKNGKTLAVSSDETTHISLDGDTLLVVDAGNPSTAVYVKALAEQAGAKNVKFFITHFHFDHVNGLEQAVKTARDKGLKVDIYFPEETVFQASGYFMSRMETLRDVISKKVQLHALALGASEAISGNSEMSVIAPPLSIAHFIHSRGYVEVNKLTKRARCYTGDINPGAFNPATGKPFGPEEVKAGLAEYYSALIKKAREEGATKLDLFIDYGHFPAEQQTYIKQFFASNSFGIEVVPHYQHNKNSKGYTFEVV